MLTNYYSHLIQDTKASEKLTEWLTLEDPLTDKLHAALGDAGLELLSQEWVKPSHWDIHVLEIDDTSVFQREILMKSHGKVYWYAKTLIPQKCYQLNPAFFKRLEHESVRHLIFNEPKVKRKKSIFYPITSQCTEYHWMEQFMVSQTGIFWLRLAEFSFQETESFYLIEILSPDLEDVT